MNKTDIALSTLLFCTAAHAMDDQKKINHLNNVQLSFAQQSKNLSQELITLQNNSYLNDTNTFKQHETAIKTSRLISNIQVIDLERDLTVTEIYAILKQNNLQSKNKISLTKTTAEINRIQEALNVNDLEICISNVEILLYYPIYVQQFIQESKKNLNPDYTWDITNDKKQITNMLQILNNGSETLAKAKETCQNLKNTSQNKELHTIFIPTTEYLINVHTQSIKDLTNFFEQYVN